MSNKNNIAQKKGNRCTLFLGSHILISVLKYMMQN